jgi:hypothetical protein
MNSKKNSMAVVSDSGELEETRIIDARKFCIKAGLSGIKIIKA